MPIKSDAKPFPQYSMNNIGPQTVQNSFTAHYADLNQDGYVDMIVGLRKPEAGIRVEWGDGLGHWTTQQGPETSLEARTVAVGDVEHDGSLDVLIGGEGDQQGLQIWHLDPDEGWLLHASPTQSGQFRAVALEDVNEDGWVDVIGAQVNSEKDGGIYVWLSDGRGDWLPHFGPLANGIYTGMTVADINGDGHLDIAASRRGGSGARHVPSNGRDSWITVGGVQVWYGDGAGRWEPEELPAESDAEGVTVADVNGDGRLDILAALYLRGIDLWLGSKTGWKKRKVTDKGSWVAVRVGDMDGDGKRELVAGSKDGKGLGLWRWAGDGFVPLKGFLPDSGTYYSVDLGDVHGKGLLDVAALRMDGATQIWSFERSIQVPAEEFVGPPIGEPFKLYFDTAQASVRPDAAKSMVAWVENLGLPPKSLYFRVIGKADARSIHSEVFPNNEALSLARAEATSALLRDEGVSPEKIVVKGLGAKEPVPAGISPKVLQQNRIVLVQPYPIASVRMPRTLGANVERDMYHIDKNTVFKTINGSPEFRVGPGDELSITLWEGGTPEVNKVTIAVDGTISLPFYQAVQINDLTPTEIDQKMTQMQARFVKQPRVDVAVTKSVSKTATIFGQVMDLQRQPTGPGTYSLRGKETLVDFISRTGGPTEKADMTQVQVIRNGKVVKLNLERAIQQADWRENAIVDDGDTVFIPSLEQAGRRVYVLGEVAKPGIVEFTGDFRLLDAVSKTGGFTEKVYYKDIRVIRADRDQPLILPVDFTLLLEQGDLTQNMALNDRDVIIIPRSPIENWNQWIVDASKTLNFLLLPVSTPADISSSIKTLNGTLANP